MSDYGPPCILCGHNAGSHGESFCPYGFGDGRGQCDCRGYCPTVEVAQLRGLLPVRPGLEGASS